MSEKTTSSPAKPPVSAEILCIGTELLLGEIVNTNATYLSRRLARLGIRVYHHSAVGDNPERLARALDVALSRSDLVLTTGGLGPTCDDLSKEVIAAHFGRALVLHPPSLERLEAFFADRGTAWTENNKKQAYQPEGAVIFPNPSGTAPGAAIEQDGKTVILLPGPPRELTLMFETEVEPYLRRFAGPGIVSRELRLFGIGESAVETLLRPLMTTQTNPTLAPYAQEGEVMLRLTASAPSEAEAYARMEPLEREIERLVGPYIYGVDVPDLQTALVRYLLEHRIRVAAAESCTGGLISKCITDVPGSSEIYPGGVCSYSNERKMQWLGVSPETLAAHGAVSAETALEMAHGIRRATGADLGVSTTGVAGPGGGTAEKPVGLVYVAVAGETLQKVDELHIRYGAQTSRDLIRNRAAKHALHLLLTAAKTLAGEGPQTPQ